MKGSQIYSCRGNVPTDCSPSCTQELHEENFSEVVLLGSSGIRKCHGCKGQIIRKKLPSPKRFGFFCKHALQIWRVNRNIYFHLTKLCVQKHNNKMTIEDVTMAADTFTLLTTKHLGFLFQKGLLEIIVVRLK